MRNSNSTGKSGTQICDAAPGGSWCGLLRLHLVQLYSCRSYSCTSRTYARHSVTGANTDPAQCVFCPFCGGAAPWHSFKFPTAVARLQRLIFRSGAVPAHMVECAGAVRCKIFALKYVYKIIQDHSINNTHGWSYRLMERVIRAVRLFVLWS